MPPQKPGRSWVRLRSGLEVIGSCHAVEGQGHLEDRRGFDHLCPVSRGSPSSRQKAKWLSAIHHFSFTLRRIR